MRTTVRALISVWLTAIATFAPAHAAHLVLNEVLANEPGSATKREWVEIVNWPDLDSAAISLEGYRFVDGNDTTVFDTAFVLQPLQYLIIAREPVGATSFEEYWGDNSGIWGDDPSESFPVVQADMALRNSADTVSLIAPDETVSSIHWESDAGDGVSFERVRPDRGDDASNFEKSRDPSGSTPGYANSVLPATNDIAFGAPYIPIGEFTVGDTIWLGIDVANVGFGMVTSATVVLERQTDFFNPQSPRELIATIQINDLPENDTTRQRFGYVLAAPGNHRLIFSISEDGNALNNDERPVTLPVRFNSSMIIISEFLANPVNGPGEWVEIFNQSDVTLDLRTVRIGDARRTVAIPGYIGMIPPGAFQVFAEDEVVFRQFYTDFPGDVYTIPDWPELNNTGDQIRLIGAAGEVIDSLTYTTVYDDNHSAERIDLGPFFSDSSDWTISVDPSGATPGRANSVDKNRAGALEMSVAPNPWFLSATEELQISVTLEIGESLTLRIFDRDGYAVRTIVHDLPSATGAVTWDGRDDHGHTVKPGPYIFYARSKPSGRGQKLVVAVGP